MSKLSDIEKLFEEDTPPESDESEADATPAETTSGESFKLVSRGGGPLRERYRPQKLQELAPTCSLLQLQNLIDNPNASKVYLFEGKTGTGKTTCARILAKASVCSADNPRDKPCLKCDSCKNFEHNFEITEINVADQRKIEDVRQLIELMRYRPGLGGCNKKIFILDEVHQYTPEAQQALLTQLEDPAPYLLVFLCTTDAHTLNPALIDRATRINFKALTGGTSAEIINQICKNENINPSDDIKESFYHKSKGSVRRLLNQIQTYIEGGYTLEGSDDEELTTDVKSIANAIMSKDFTDLIVALRRPSVKKDPEDVRFKLSSYFRAIILSVNSDNIPKNDYKTALQFTNALARLTGRLGDPIILERYNELVTKCVRAFHAFDS